MNRSRHAFYSITKDDILDRLNLDGSPDDTGTILVSYSDWQGQTELRLTDQPFTEHGFALAGSEAPTSVGSQVKISGNSVSVDHAYSALDQVIGQFSLFPGQLRVPQLQATQVRLVIEQQISEILRQSGT